MSAERVIRRRNETRVRGFELSKDVPWHRRVKKAVRKALKEAE